MEDPGNRQIDCFEMFFPFGSSNFLQGPHQASSSWPMVNLGERLKKTVSLPSYFSTAEKELLQDTVLRYTMLHKLYNLWHNVVKGGFIIV